MPSATRYFGLVPQFGQLKVLMSTWNLILEMNPLVALVKSFWVRVDFIPTELSLSHLAFYMPFLGELSNLKSGKVWEISWGARISCLEFQN